MKKCVIKTLIITCLPVIPWTAVPPACPAATLPGGGTVRAAEDRAPDIVDRVIASSKEYLGKPYKFRNPYGRTMDCGGFISYVWSLHGVSLPPSSSDIAHQVQRVPLDEAEKGDLLFFKGRRKFLRGVGHVSMIVDRKGGRIRMIHSCSRGVVIDDYPTEYYSQRFLFAGRIPGLPREARTPEAAATAALSASSTQLPKESCSLITADSMMPGHPLSPPTACPAVVRRSLLPHTPADCIRDPLLALN